jgi:hypothetical protein
MIHGVKIIKCIWLVNWDFLKGEERYENIWVYGRPIWESKCLYNGNHFDVFQNWIQFLQSF